MFCNDLLSRETLLPEKASFSLLREYLLPVSPPALFKHPIPEVNDAMLSDDICPILLLPSKSERYATYFNAYYIQQ